MTNGKSAWQLTMLAVMCLSLLAASRLAYGTDVISDDWPTIVSKAKGQTVYFNAWGGSDAVNSYLEWTAEELDKRYGVTLKHVKIGDVSEVVQQIEAAKLVGRDDDGNVDLMWVNGENFAHLKANNLIVGPFAESLPNAAFVMGSPSIIYDFSVPVEGYESPWGGAQLVFIYDSAVVESPPLSAQALLEFAKEGGRFSYPAPPDFHGTTFVKQLLLELTEQPKALAKAVDQADFDAVTAPLWDYLDALHPLLWGKAKSWPQSAATMLTMLDEGELDISLSFNPNEAATAVKNEQLPETVRTYTFTKGTIGNTHFVTIPYNAKAKAGAMIVADFLLSPEAQARKADTQYWGDPSVLDQDKLSDKDKQLFVTKEPDLWSLPLSGSRTLAEPHSSWNAAIEQAWQTRYKD